MLEIYHIMVGANVSFSTVFICQERLIFAESTHFTCKNTLFKYFPKTFTKKSKWAIIIKNPLCECYLNNLLSQFYYRLEVASMYDVETKFCSIFTFCDTKK